MIVPKHKSEFHNFKAKKHFQVKHAMLTAFSPLVAVSDDVTTAPVPHGSYHNTDKHKLFSAQVMADELANGLAELCGR